MPEDAFIVKGGVPLRGTVKLSGAKNVALKVLIASLLYEEPVSFQNIPHLKDIIELGHLLRSTGASVKFEEGNMTIDPRTALSHEVDLLHGSKMRVSFMLFAPFLKKFGKARIPNPGGCRIGARPIDRMISLMDAFGVRTTYDSETGYYDATLDGKELQGAQFTFNKKTHTGTELAILLAVLARGHSIIGNAALEPEIDDLINFLNTSGASIQRSGEEIHIDGVEGLRAPALPYAIACDRNNAVTYAIFGLATDGDVTVEGAQTCYLDVFFEYLDRINAGYEKSDTGIRFFRKGDLHASEVMTSPEPGFMTDWQAPWAVLMTQAHGISTIHETVFENRFGYVAELNKLGAHIEFYQPEVENPHELYQFDIHDIETFRQSQQGIRIYGPTALHWGALRVTDMRAGATLLIGACIAHNETVVIGASEIDRGYDNIEVHLAKLGANIRRL
jgi:UDP-N-acetylglucosamine 1-carboxyvinyltransferase